MPLLPRRYTYTNYLNYSSFRLSETERVTRGNRRRRERETTPPQDEGEDALTDDEEEGEAGGGPGGEDRGPDASPGSTIWIKIVTS
jgi:hypothetical protein